MKHADAVSKPRMSCTWIYEFGEAQLLYSSKPLKRPALEQLPHDAFKLVMGVELDKIVNGVSNSLNSHAVNVLFLF
jgi:hypothetical protein